MVKLRFMPSPCGPRRAGLGAEHGDGGALKAAQYLAEVKACFGCGEASAALLCEAMTARHFANRSTIARAGDECAHFYLVLEGAVVAEIFGFDGQQVQLARHGPGEVFGAYPAIANCRSDLVVQGEATVLAAPVGQLTELAQSHAEIAASVAALLARQLDLVLDRMAARIGLSATGRFYRVLLQLGGDDGRISPMPVISALALSVHTTRETASRALAALVRRGIVERNDAGLTIVSRRMLEEMVV
jgi:CRP/FNR family transcriptional regulator, cyclic AMP receptor protein